MVQPEPDGVIDRLRRVAVLTIALLSSALPSGQDRQTIEPPKFRVSVEVVRIDAVVTDGDGRVVRDLTASDFDVYQDGKRQKVTYAQFVPVATGTAPAAVLPPRTRTAAPVLPVAPVRREHIQRTLVLVIDDLGLSWESTYYTKQALHSYIDRELQPSDIVAIVRTAASSDMQQAFTTDRRVLHAAIDAIRWNVASRSGVEAFESLNRWTTFDSRGGMDPTDFTRVDAVRSSMLAAGTLGALNLAIRGIRDMPGRKAVILASEGFSLLDPNASPGMAVTQPDYRVRQALDRAIDQAARAGVVVYTIDCRGLQSGAFAAADNVKNGALPSPMERQAKIRDTQEALSYLAEQTGGFAVLNTNDLGRGFQRITEDIRDYYLIGYVPDEDTFSAPRTKPTFHKISIKVRRPGLRVRTRREFLGVSDPLELPVVETPVHQLVKAATSPFTATDIALRATALPGYSREEGPFVRALLHIDARDLTFADDNGSGKKTASADVLGMAFDQEGVEVAHLSTGFAVAMTDEAARDALRDGLEYSLRIPIPHAGAYQVRFALRDQHSGRLGSAGEFVEVPDVSGGAFALSGILLQAGEGTSALRSFHRGTALRYSYEIYNAASEVRVAASVWRGEERGIEKVATVPIAILTAPTDSDGRFGAGGELKLGENIPVGSYLLRLAASTPDSKNRAKIRTAVQQIAFEVE